ncbi:MAG: LysR family transcriptional regulator [Treponema sp.]|nr:LysR family transcriptional regulator [Treponema sp.]
MNSIQIQYFIKVAETLNFTAAANMLYVSQPAVSRQVALLEKELSVILFKRTTHGIKLTRAGELIYDYFVSSCKQLDEILKEVHTEQQYNIYVGIHEGLPIEDIDKINQAVFTFTEDIISTVDITMRSMNFFLLDQMLENGIDNVIISPEYTIRRDNDIVTVPLKPNQRALIYSKALFAELKKEPVLSDFERKTLSFFDSSTTTPEHRKALIRVLKSLGIKPCIREVSNREDITYDIISGRCYTIGTVSTRELQENSRLEMFLLDSYSVLCAAYRKKSASVIEKFTKVLKTHFNTASNE